METLQETFFQTIENALLEDRAYDDITSIACVDCDDKITASIVSMDEGIIAALPLLEKIFQKIDPACQIERLVEEGERVKKGQELVLIRGRATNIFSCEKIACNFLSHASGIATYAEQYKVKLTPYSCDIFLGRNTTPTLRSLEHYASRMGGASNRVFSLSERFIIEQKHLAYLAMRSANPLETAIKRAKEMQPSTLIEVQASTMHEVEDALFAAADVISLRNFSLNETLQASQLVQKQSYLDVSGTYSVNEAVEIAKCGVDGITHESLAFDAKALPVSIHL